MDDYLHKIDWSQIDERAVDERMAFEALPTVIEQRDGKFFARKGQFMGIGETERHARAEMAQKICLHYYGDCWRPEIKDFL